MSIKTIDMEDYKKKYEEALERAKDQLEKLKVVNVHGDVLEYIFPELAEPGDEKIRKELIDFFSASHATDTFRGISWDRVVSWLEKQGEQKPYGQREECTDCQFNYAGECKGFCAMKRGEQKPVDVRTTGYWNVQDIEQKPAWSEEDEIGLGDALWAIQQARTIAKDENDMGNLWYAENWLKTLKDRVQPQNTWKPSDEQMRVLKKACDEHWEPDGLEPLYTLYQDLEKLRE